LIFIINVYETNEGKVNDIASKENMPPKPIPEPKEGNKASGILVRLQKKYD